MWEVRARIQGFKREFHIHIHLDYARIEILSYIKKKNFGVLLLFTHRWPVSNMNPISPVRTSQFAKSTHMWIQMHNHGWVLWEESKFKVILLYIFLFLGKDRWGIINLPVNQPLQRKSSLKEHPPSKLKEGKRKLLS